MRPAWTIAKRSVFLWVIVLGVNLHGTLLAQKEHVRFERISLESGLSQSTVTCLIEDHDGFMWFGTQDGLNKYDGYHFTVYRHDAVDSNSLSDSYIRSLYEDHEGYLWVGTSRGGSGGGLNKFDPESKKFTRYLHDPNDPKSLSHNYINAILEDTLYKCMWIGTARGLNRFDRVTKTSVRYYHDPALSNTISDDYILTIYKDRSGAYWVGTANGLNRFDPETGIFTRYLHDPKNDNSLSDNYVLLVGEDHAGYLWIATLRGGLDRFDKRTGTFTHFRNIPGNPNSLSHDHVESFYEDKAGFIWVGTDGGGVNKFNPATGQWSRYTYNPGDLKSISNDRVWCMYGSANGVIWIGNYAGGINKIDRAEEKFSVFKHEPNEQNTLYGSVVFAVYEDDASGNVWIGTDDAGLNVLNRSTGLYSHYYKDDPGNSGLGANQITAIMKDRSGSIWVAASAGLYRWDPIPKKFRLVNTGPEDFFSKGSGNLILSVMEDRDGLMWIGTDGAGVYTWERASNRWKNYRKQAGEKNSLRNNVVWSIFQQASGQIWLGTEGGLLKFNQTDGSFTAYQNDPNDTVSLSNNKVFSFCEDRAGRLWIATSGGLNRLTDPQGRFERYTETEGLANNCVYAVMEDRRGRLWMSTNYGLSVFDPQTSKFRNYDVGDGLPANEFSTGGYYRNAKGLMYFGGINGFVTFDPDSVRDNQVVPPIVITGFSKLNKKQVLDKPISKLNELELAYNENVFSFDFVALNYVSSEKNRYAYKLEGFDKDWVYCGNRQFASYTNLDPGEYVFQVKGSNNDGLWNEKGASVRIKILPPPWKTWWFRIGAFLVLIGIAYAAYHYRVNKLLELERLRTKIASDLHDDVGATLTKISMYSELIGSGINPLKHKGLLESISGMSREVITTMSDIVWSIDARNDTMQNMIDRMNDFAHSILSNKQIDLNFKTQDLKDSRLSFEIRQNIYLIFKEAVNNIARHSGANEVVIELAQRDNAFRMFIHDNGRGFDTASNKAGHGLKNMRVRAQRVKGEIHILNQTGTTIELTVKNII